LTGGRAVVICGLIIPENENLITDSAERLVVVKFEIVIELVLLYPVQFGFPFRFNELNTARQFPFWTSKLEGNSKTIPDLLESGLERFKVTL
jgi:hypothetical protein